MLGHRHTPILQVVLIGYAAGVSLYAGLHYPTMVRSAQAAEVALPPITLWLRDLGLIPAIALGLALSISVPICRLNVTHRPTRILIGILLIGTSLLFTTFLLLAVWTPCHRLAHWQAMGLTNQLPTGDRDSPSAACWARCQELVREVNAATAAGA